MNDIKKFIAHIGTNGITKQNQFTVTFSIPPLVLDKLSTSDASEVLNLMCTNFDFPGSNLDSQTITTSGHHHKSGYLTNYTDIDFTFYLSRNMSEKVVFETWLAVIQNKESKSMNYTDDYSVDMQVQTYIQSVSESPDTYDITLIKAYPVVIAPISMDKTSNNSFSTLTVSMTYESITDTKALSNFTNKENPVILASESNITGAYTEEYTKLEVPFNMIENAGNGVNVDNRQIKKSIAEVDEIFDEVDKAMTDISGEARNIYLLIKDNIKRLAKEGKPMTAAIKDIEVMIETNPKLLTTDVKLLKSLMNEIKGDIDGIL